MSEPTPTLDAWFQSGDRSALIIGEVAQAHDGSLGQAHAYIDLVADAGCDAVKFQTHIAAEESTPAEPWRVQFSRQDETRLDYWRRMEFTEEQWRGLAEHARERGLWFLSSPFSVAAVELLQRVGVAAWKLASGELNHEAMLERIHQTGAPVILSTGMSPWSEIDALVDRFSDRPLAILQCTSDYPCPPERVGLNVISELDARYGVPVGLSDHSGTIFPGLAGAALGMQLLEVHVTFHRGMFGPDVPASLLPGELAELVRGVRFIERMRRSPVDKDDLAAELEPMRSLFRRSLVAARPLAAGRVLEPGDLVAKKPGSGIDPARAGELIGRRLRRDLAADELLAVEDVEDAE